MADKTGIAVCIILIIVLSLSGCLGCGTNSNNNPSITIEPSAQPTSIVPGVVNPGAEDSVSAVTTQDRPEPAITSTDKGYILKDVTGAEDTAQVQLKAGKATFYIRLPNYSIGDRYTLTMVSVGEPFSYRSTNEFTGHTGAGGMKIDKRIPYDGTYQIGLDYGGSWEIEIAQ